MPSKLTMLRSGLFACLFMLSSLVSMSQDRKITGKVTDASNLPVAGATIAVKGSNVATQTNADGIFSLTVPANSVLVVSFVGFEPREYPVGTQSNLSISLTSATSNLNEVVVTGYSSQQRRNIVGAVSTIKGDELATVPSGNPEQQFQGRVPGVTVITSGQPGSVSQVRIRGFGSFSSNEPLYVVDGVPVFNIDYLNANDIESSTVLKDAASASIYGARASAGVILMTTKKGKYGSNKLSVTYDGMYGVTIPSKGIDLLTPQQQADLTWSALAPADRVTHPQYGGDPNKAVLPDYLKAGDKSGVMTGDPAIDFSKYNVNFEKGPVYQIIKANKAGTNWYDELTSTRPMQNHTLGMRGGNESARYYAGLSYYNEQGPVINTYLKKYSLRLNTEFKVKNVIRLGQNFQYTFRDRPGIDGPASENDILFALTINPLIPVYDEGPRDAQGNLTGPRGFAGTTAKGFNNSTQPVARRIRSENNRGFASTMIGNVYAEVDILKHVTARTSFGGTFNQYQYRFIDFRTYENSENVGSNTFGEGAGNSAGWVWTNTIKYSQTFGNHDINFIGGIEAIADGFSRNLNGQGLNPFSLSNSYLTISNTDPQGRVTNSNGSPLTKLYSQFGKLDYAYNDRYLFSATLRRDGASVFGESNKYGVFPAVSAGWRITQEDFMKNVTWANELKIRGGYGKMGGSRIGTANGVNSAGSSGFAYDITGSNTGTVPGLALTGIGNPFAKWETNATLNIGFDGTFFNNRLDVIFDWYKRKTSDLLFQQELAATNGIATPPFVNIGSMENKGIDVMLTYKGGDRRPGAFRYEADVILTTYTNTITKVSDITNYFDVGFTGRIGGGFVRNAVGQAVSSFYGYKVLGLFQSDADVTASPTQTGAAPGRFKFADINGDKNITDADRTFIGNPNPDFTYGFNARLLYKGFDLEALFYGVSGGQVLNFTRWFTDFYPSFAGIGKSSRVLNAWTPQNTNTNIPKFENVSNFSTNTELNSYYVENSSYLRLRSLKLGYDINPRILGRTGFERVRLFVQGTNLFTSTKYTGTDPAVSGVDTNFGVDVGNYPVNKQVLFGVSLGL